MKSMGSKLLVMNKQVWLIAYTTFYMIEWMVGNEWFIEIILGLHSKINVVMK
jgi:hypothetical protein